nr:hypothetical protein [Nanoarchaeota archaeon]
MKSTKLALCIILGLMIVLMGVVSVAAFYYPYYKPYRYTGHNYYSPYMHYGSFYGFGWYRPTYYYRSYPSRYNYYYRPYYSPGYFGGWW